MFFRKRKQKIFDNSFHDSSLSLLTKKTKTVADKGRNFFYFPKILLALFLVTLGLITVRIYYSNQLALSGAKVSYLENQMIELKKENAALENQVSQKSSLSYIEAKAQELGMVKLNKVEVLGPVPPVALGR